VVAGETGSRGTVMERGIGLVCGDECGWKGWSMVWAGVAAATFLIMGVKLVDARHQIGRLEAKLEAR
jgi:hypothetical protein